MGCWHIMTYPACIARMSLARGTVEVLPIYRYLELNFFLPSTTGNTRYDMNEYILLLEPDVGDHLFL